MVILNSFKALNAPEQRRVIRTSLPSIVGDLIHESRDEIHEKGLKMDSSLMLFEPGCMATINLPENSEGRFQAEQILDRHLLDPNEKVTLSEELKKSIEAIRNWGFHQFSIKKFDEDKLRSQAAQHNEKVDRLTARAKLKELATVIAA